MAIVGVPPDRQFYKKFKFVVEIAGVESASFSSMSDIRIQVAKVEHFEGGALTPSKQPGRVTVPDVTLQRGATSDLDLYNWMQEVVGADAILVDPAQKRTIDLVQQDRAGNELRRWTLVNAWPIDWGGGSWDNNVDENVIEEVILAYDYPILGGDSAA